MSVDATFPGRIGLIQRVLTPYRVPVFDLLAARCAGGLSVLAGDPAPNEALATSDRLEHARLHAARNRYALPGSLQVFWQEAAEEWLREWQPDALIVEANPRCLSLRRSVRWMRERGRPVLGWGMGAPRQSVRLAALRRARVSRMVRRFDGMLAYGSRGAREYVEAGAPSDRVFVCNNAVARRPIGAPPSRPDDPGERPTVLYVGRLVPAKRVDTLIEACALLAKSSSPIVPELRIVGGGPARAQLERLALARSVDASLPGALHGDSLDAEFARADLFVMPGQGGLAVQEALAHALPVIVGEGDGTQEDLVVSGNGWHIPPSDAEAMAEAMRRALSDPVALRRKGLASFAIAQEVNVEALVDAMVDALNVTSGSSRGRRAQPSRGSTRR